MRSRDTYGPDALDMAHDAALDEHCILDDAIDARELELINRVRQIAIEGWDGDSLPGPDGPLDSDLLSAGQHLMRQLDDAQRLVCPHTDRHQTQYGWTSCDDCRSELEQRSALIFLEQW